MPPGSAGKRMPRRSLMLALPVLPLLATPSRSRAAANVSELALACDITLGPALRAVAAAYRNVTGVRVSVFPTEPGLILPQLQRSVQNDIVVTQIATLNAAVQGGIVAPGAARGAWRNGLIIAGKRGAPQQQDKPIAVCDPSPASDMDGPAILARLGLLPTPTLGVIDTDTVAALVLNGTARAGLLHRTDLSPHAELEVMSVVADEVQPAFAYAAAVTRLARRPDPAAFVQFLVSSQVATMLAAYGLEIPS